MLLDGYTLTALIQHGQYVAQFTYRPMLSHERRQFLQMGGGWDRSPKNLLRLGWLGSHIVCHGNLPNLATLRDTEPLLFKRVGHVLMGVAPPDNDNGLTPHWEAETQQNLHDGVVLEMTQPSLAKRSCGDCLKYLWDEDVGRKVFVFGDFVIRTNEMPTLCQLPQGCPVGTPETAKRLTAQNKQAWHHFRLCTAAGGFPDDQIVLRNAAVIQAAMKEVHGGRHDVGGVRSGSRRIVAGNGRAGTADDGGFFSAFGDIPI